MYNHCTPCDREAETHSSRLVVSGIVDAIKRLEDVWQFLLGNARAPITNGDRNRGVLANQIHVDRTAFSGISDGISDHVLDGTPKQFLIGHNNGSLGRLQVQAATASVGLKSAR